LSGSTSSGSMVDWWVVFMSCVQRVVGTSHS